ncbi:hypothetical protein [Nonomuraea rubra]|uniref:hypothetical protein n=1 Tax=Nonomuraea rubra TaxID=46180 RepID=UPI0033FACAAF
MRFGILGETRAWRDDGAEVPLGGPARRALLTLLLLRPGEIVPADRLAGEIGPARSCSPQTGWPGRSGRTGCRPRALQSQVSRLRAALGPGGGDRAGRQRVLARGR